MDKFYYYLCIKKKLTNISTEWVSKLRRHEYNDREETNFNGKCIFCDAKKNYYDKEIERRMMHKMQWINVKKSMHTKLVKRKKKVELFLWYENWMITNQE